MDLVNGVIEIRCEPSEALPYVLYFRPNSPLEPSEELGRAHTAFKAWALSWGSIERIMARSDETSDI
jgi:hypothetical protein